MPALSAQSAIFRRGGYTFTGYISTPPQTVVLSGTISTVPTYPATQLSYTLDSGATADALPDLLVNFYSSGGVKKATLRIATGQTVTSVVLPVSEFSQGVYDVAVNDTFEVVRVWNIWDRLVSATATLNKDSRIAYTDQGSNPPPICNSGGASAGFNPLVDFDGSASFAVDPDSGGSITHAWAFGDGTPSTSSSATPSGVSFPVGFRWVQHSATDASNSKTTYQYVPVWVHDRSIYAPLAVQMDSLSADVENGWRCSFKLPKGTEGNLATLPDGALIVYWELERYGTSESSYGSNVSNRSQVKFVGYLVSDSVHIEPDSNEVTFEAVSPLAILEQTPALPQLMVSASSPSKWSEIKTLSTRRALWYLSYWHSSLINAFDFVWIDGLDTTYDRLATEADSIAGQLRDIGDGLNIQITCDRLGRIYMTKNPDYMNASDRNGRTKTYDLTTADIMSIDIPRNHRGSVKFVRGEGIATGNKAVFSNAPGNAPAPFAPATDTLSKQIVSNQTDLNNRTGWHFARLNGLYNGQFVPQDARVTLPDGYDVFDPATREFLTLTLASTFNSRGVGFDNTTKWTVEAINISYDLDNGAKEIELTLDHETIGAAGITYVPPQESIAGLGDWPPLDLQFLDFGVDFGSTRTGTQTLAAFCTDNNLYITDDFDTPSAAGGPTWRTVNLTALSGWPGGTVLQFEVDAYSPKYLGTGTTVNGWVCTDGHIFRISDIFGTTAISDVYAFVVSSNLRNMRFERGEQNFGIVTSYYIGVGTKAAYTTDGINWTEVSVSTNYDTDGTFGWYPGIYIDPHTAGRALTSAFTAVATGAGQSATLRETVDHGATWSTLSSPTTNVGRGLAHNIINPYTDTSKIYYAHTSETTAFDPRLYRNNTDVSPIDSGNYYGPFQLNRSISIDDNNANNIVVCGADDYTGATTNYGVFISQDGGNTWVNLIAPSTTLIYEQSYVNSASAIYLIGAIGAIGFSDGISIDSRAGNISTSGHFRGICGG